MLHAVHNKAAIEQREQISILENTIKSQGETLISQRNQLEDIQNKCRQFKRANGDTSTSSNSSDPAFYAYLEAPETNPKSNMVVKFDTPITNIGGAYNIEKGLFTVPRKGVYVFSWTIVSSDRGVIFTQIVVNSEPIGSMITHAEQSYDFHTTTTVAVKELNQGDVVFIRTNPHSRALGYINSGVHFRSSFSGWSLK
ncbi:Hypothetical predicted protein [Mytilus galloprovincialis]|uniref:C1q domain-containing protein n=1 Tax=Mytilus galloprovincialis TaxID=29158 RepID=A0A8B6CHZ9_MYTGA|nr:Hypothetical predicted protein [Mytilus galloprovincialis]